MSLPLLLSAPDDYLPIPDGYLWLLGVGLVLAALLVAFVGILLRRDWPFLGTLTQRLDAFLAAHLPRAWPLAKRRLSPDAWHGLALTVATLLVLGGLMLFVLITDSWMDQEALFALDQRVNRLLDGLLTTPTAEVIVVLTDAGSVPFTLALSMLLLIWFAVRRYRWRILALLLTMGAGQGVLWLLKAQFGRARPETRYYTPEGASFPSGHTFTATVFYGFCIFLTWRHLSGRPAQFAATALMILLILSVGVSRLLLGVHWVSDVLGGLTLGMAWLTFSLIATRSLRAARQG
jgi:membrane-associated phospholipid phosphatase